MSDEPTAESIPAHVQIAEALLADPGTTFSKILAAGPLVLAHVVDKHPEHFARVRSTHTEWVRQGRPASWSPTVPFVPEPARAPEPAAPAVAAPDPAGIATMRDLTRLGATAFATFRTAYPDRFAELARAAGFNPTT